MILTILCLCFSYAQTTECAACQNCTCNSRKVCPMLLQYDDNLCLRRANSYSIRPQCHNQFNIKTIIEIRSLDPAANYNLYIFDNAGEFINYMACKEFKTAHSRLDQSCTPRTTFLVNSTLMTVVIECLSNNDCAIFFDHLTLCDKRADTSYGLGIAGLVLCAIVLVLCIIFAVILIVTRYKYGGIRITYGIIISLSTMSLTAVLNTVFWILFFLFYDKYSAGLAQTIFWIDKIVLLLTILVHLYLLFQWVIVIHPTATKIITMVFVGTGILSIILMLITMMLHQFNIQGTLMLTIFYGFSYGVDFVISIIFLVYGIMIIKLSDNRSQNIKIVTFIAIMIVFNFSRCVVAAYYWIAAISPNPDWVTIAGLYNISFPSYAGAMVFYIFVFIIPDTVPSIIVLFILMSSIQKSTKDDRLSEILLADRDAIPKRYSDY